MLGCLEDAVEEPPRGDMAELAPAPETEIAEAHGPLAVLFLLLTREPHDLMEQERGGRAIEFSQRWAAGDQILDGPLVCRGPVLGEDATHTGALSQEARQRGAKMRSADVNELMHVTEPKIVGPEIGTHEERQLPNHEAPHAVGDHVGLDGGNLGVPLI